MGDSHDTFRDRPSGPNWSRINQWVLWIGLAAAIGWMFFRHNAHLLQLLPFLILLACPLMHLFGHGGHGGHDGHREHDPRQSHDGSRGTPDRRPSDDRPPVGGLPGHRH